jgi:hypothetical protein
MKQFTVYFELFGKKMKTEVFANSESDAKKRISEKIIFHKVEVGEETILKSIKDIFPFL